MGRVAGTSAGMKSFALGEIVVLRWRRNHPADVVMPVRVIVDSPDHIALFTAAGTVMKGQATADGRKLTRDTPFLKRESMIGGLADFTWTGNHVLQFIKPGEARSIWMMWDEKDWSFRGWYVNLQAPIQRTTIGFDTADYLLDLEVSPKLIWSWKDRDEVEEARTHGLVDPEILDQMELEGKRVIRDIEARAWPFNTDFESWRPEPAWDIPSLPDDWDKGLHEPFMPVFNSETSAGDAR